MARRIRIPLLVDLVQVTAPETVRDLPAHPALDRGFQPAGPLVNRVICGRLRDVLRTETEPLPSLRRRDDRVRAATHAALTERFSGEDPAGRLDGETVTGLVALIRGEGGSAGELAQQLIGRLFVADYRATAETWAAARDLQKAAESRNPFLRLFLALTGRIRRARQVLSEAAGDDAAAVHGTAIAVHNLVVSVERLAALYADPAERARTGPEQAVARALAGPPTILRQADRDADSLAGPLRPGTLVTFAVRDAGERTLDPAIVFMRDGWSVCPAHRLVPAALAALWSEAVGSVTGAGR